MNIQFMFIRSIIINYYMEIVLLDKQDSNYFLQALNELVNENINLPKKAIDHYLSLWDVEKIKSVSGQYVLIVAKENEKIIGLVLGTPPEGGVGTIIWVLVSQEYQKTGIGQQLMNKAIYTYKEKGAHKIKLTVPDEGTVKFYEKLGMIVEGHHVNHWWNHDFWAMGLII